MSPLPRARRITSKRRNVRLAFVILGAVFIVWALLVVGLGAAASRGIECTACHAMRPYANAVAHEGHSAVQCAECHRTAGRYGWVQDGLAMQRWMVGQALGRTPVPGWTPDDNCRSCHSKTLRKTVVANGLRVRHVEVLDKPCTECHGGSAHRVPKRVYATPEMEACTQCHAASTSDLVTCDFCHVSDATSASSSDKTQWRSTHGPNWESTHGAGELSTCIHCHPEAMCVSCHGVPVPHLPTWPKIHGHGLPPDIRVKCAQCHDPAWCDNCHGGIEMPHSAEFIKTHGPQATAVGTDKCQKCHVQAGCDECHLQASHPQLPGLTPQHGGL